MLLCPFSTAPGSLRESPRTRSRRDPSSRQQKRDVVGVCASFTVFDVFLTEASPLLDANAIVLRQGYLKGDLRKASKLKILARNGEEIPLIDREYR